VFTSSVEPIAEPVLDYCGNGLTILLKESLLDSQYTRFGLFATAPLFFFISLVSGLVDGCLCLN
jgi:hypothetical protein